MCCPCLSVPPGGVYSPLNRAAYTLHCHYVMTLCPLLAAGCFVIMSGIVCAVLFSGRAPYLFTRCILSSRSIRKLFFQGTFRACGSCFICARIARPPACWMLPCKEKYSRVLLFGTLNNCKSEFSTLYTSRNFHHKNDLISSNVHPSGILPHLSIVHRESPVQVTASHDTGQHPTALDAKRFHIVPIGGSDSHSSMLHPAASPPTFDPLAKWPASWFNAGTQRTTQTDQQEKRCIA